MRLPTAIQNLIESFERLPGIGPKSAQRLTFYLLHVPQGELDKFAGALQNLKKDTVLCSKCFTIGETNPCSICTDPNRDHSIICVVEQPLDVLALEKNGKYKGVYHVLHGKIDPLNNIGPDEIYIGHLMKRVREASPLRHPLRQGYEGQEGFVGQAKVSEVSNGEIRVNPQQISEIILATNPTMEGEATAMYIAKQLSSLISHLSSSIKITRIGRGLPIGADLEYADEVTLQRAMEGRSEY